MALQSIQASIEIGDVIMVLTFISSWIIFIVKVSRDFKRERRIHNNKFATKEDVNKDIKAMEKKIDSIELKCETDRKENLAAHQQIKTDITEHFDKRFDDFKDYMRDLMKKRA